MEGLYVKILRVCIVVSLAALIAGLAALPAWGPRLLGYALWAVVASPYVALAALALEKRERRIALEVALILGLVALDIALSMGALLGGA